MMKTIEELYNEVIANVDLKEEFKKAYEENKVEEFLKKNGCDATMEDLEKFASEEIPLSEDELDTAAGGGSACLTTPIENPLQDGGGAIENPIPGTGGGLTDPIENPIPGAGESLTDPFSRDDGAFTNPLFK